MFINTYHIGEKRVLAEYTFYSLVSTCCVTLKKKSLYNLLIEIKLFCIL